MNSKRYALVLGKDSAVIFLDMKYSDVATPRIERVRILGDDLTVGLLRFRVVLLPQPNIRELQLSVLRWQAACGAIQAQGPVQQVFCIAAVAIR